MAVTTEAQRVLRINQLLGELNRMPPEKQHGTLEVPGPGGQLIFCKVVTIGVDDVVLNPNSHRVRAQLQDDPEWAKHAGDPYGEGAQRIIQRLVREARKPTEFAALKNSLAKDGQSDPGVVTSSGVLINANTRAVALRELDDPSKRYIRVGVLPDTFQPEELSLLELHLQMRKEHKAAYSFTNELLFIEELSQRHMSSDQIAAKLDIESASPAKGAKVVEDRLRYLDLIREMQELVAPNLRLTFFDSVSYEHLEQLYAAWRSEDGPEATRVLEAFLLSVAVEFKDVKKMRKVDPDFVADYVIPLVAEDGLTGPHIAALAAAPSPNGGPAGVDALLGDAREQLATVNLRPLIEAVVQDGSKVPVPGTDFVLDRDEVKGSLRSAFELGIKERNTDTTASNKLQAPLDLMTKAAQTVQSCQTACGAVVSSKEFGPDRRKSLEAKFNRLFKNVQALEADLIEAEVLTKKRT